MRLPRRFAPRNDKQETFGTLHPERFFRNKEITEAYQL